MDAISDPVGLVDSLEPDVIRARINELDRQGRALRVLLRAAIARERVTRRQQITPRREGGTHEAA
jgi:hypothetical protein